MKPYIVYHSDGRISLHVAENDEDAGLNVGITSAVFAPGDLTWRGVMIPATREEAASSLFWRLVHRDPYKEMAGGGPTVIQGYIQPVKAPEDSKKEKPPLVSLLEVD